MVKIYLGIPSRNYGSWGMYDSVLRNLAILSQNRIGLSIEPHVGDSLICRARQEMTWKFLQTDCTHFMQLDDDIALPSNGMLKLIQADKPIIGGAYRLKYTSGASGDKMVTDGDNVMALRALKTFNINDVDEIMQVQYLSTGCFLQKREAVETMWHKYEKLKYYADSIEKKEDERRALYMPMIYDNGYLSEDWAYCQRAIDIGYDIWLHTGVKCGHWGLYNYKI